MAVFGADVYGKTKYGGNVLVDFGVDPFVASALNFSTVRLTWNRPGGNWSAFRLLRSRAGFAVTADENSLVGEWVSEGLPLEYHDHDVSGGWVYYSVFLFNDDHNRWEKVAVASVMVPYDYQSRNKLWGAVPDVYKFVNENSAAGYSQTLYDINPAIYLNSDESAPNTHLVKFMHVLGWGFDILRSQADSILDGYNTGAMHVSRLEALADQFGTELEQSVTAGNNRSLVKNLGLLYRKRGTVDGLRELLSLTTGLPVEVYVGPNTMLNNDESSFLHPMVPEWDSGIKYNDGDWVQRAGRYYEALQAAYGEAQAPDITGADTAYWSASVFVARSLNQNRVDTGDVGTWQVQGPGGYLPGRTFIAAGTPDPTGDDGEATNSLGFDNVTGATNDFVLRTVPRYAASPTEHSQQLVFETGIPVSNALDEYLTSNRYQIGDLVMWRGAPYEAVRLTDKDPSTDDWRRIGVDERARLALSFYAHGPWSGVAGTGGVVVNPAISFYDERGNLLDEVTLDQTSYSGVTYDPFNVGGGLVTGRTVEVGGEVWTVTNDWGQSVLDRVGGFVYPINDIRTLATVDAGTSDGDVSATLSQVGHRPLGVLFRYSDANNFWFATQDRLYRNVGGAGPENPVNGALTWEPFVHGDKMTVSLSGNVITIKKNGSVVGTTTDPFNSTATRHGLIVEPIGAVTVTEPASYADLSEDYTTYQILDEAFTSYAEQTAARDEVV